MRINFGYVAISMKLKDASPNKTVTLKNLSKLDVNVWRNKITSLAQLNLENTIRIIRYNKAYGIKLYRFTSKLVPLVTHSEFSDWNWKEDLKQDFAELGRVVHETEMRVSTHPDHFTLLNSPKKEVLVSSIKDLDYHCSMFELAGLGDECKMVLHVGGMYKNKQDSIKRFYEGFLSLEERIRKRIILENDDKLFNALDVLEICRNLKIPMVLDIHHDMCNPSGERIESLISDIFDTWKGQMYSPKIHVSSPKSESDLRSHHDYINSEEFLRFIAQVKEEVFDFDVMVEAKMKDEAVFRLIDDLRNSGKVRIAGNASIEI